MRDNGSALPTWAADEAFEIRWDASGRAEWAPLNRVIPVRGMPVWELERDGGRRMRAVLTRGDFMWMGTAVRADGGLTIHQYKHRGTRRYLLIDTDGFCYRSAGPVAGDWLRSIYAPVGTTEALEWVLS
jgi:hypothetical protein